MVIPAQLASAKCIAVFVFVLFIVCFSIFIYLFVCLLVAF